MWSIAQLAQWPRSPSALLGFDRIVDEWTCLGFDLEVVRFYLTIEGRLHETVEVPAPRSRGKRPTMSVPKYTLGQLLGIEDEQAAPARDGRPRVTTEGDPYAKRLNLGRLRDGQPLSTEEMDRIIAETAESGDG